MENFQGLPGNERSSSRILKPPGGGHSDIFGASETKVNHARPKYDQQNSSNISGALGTTDANEIAEATAREIETKNGKPAPPTSNILGGDGATQQGANNAPTGRGRVPPGGHSAGFW